MSRSFSKVVAKDTIGQVWEFFARGFIQDDDDFFQTDIGVDILNSTSGNVYVTSDVYSFGVGEQEKASEADVNFIFDHIDDWEDILQPDHLETFSFTIYPIVED